MRIFDDIKDDTVWFDNKVDLKTLNDFKSLCEEYSQDFDDCDTHDLMVNHIIDIFYDEGIETTIEDIHKYVFDIVKEVFNEKNK